MTAGGPRGSSLIISVLVTVFAVAGAMVLVVRLPGRASEMTSRVGRGRAGPGRHTNSAAPRVAVQPCAGHQGRARLGRAGDGRAGPHRPGRHRPSEHRACGRYRPSRTAPASTAPASTAPVAGEPTATGQVLALINQARAAAGLPAYTISSGLDTSAARHTAVMAGGCGLSHQCPGEPALGDRETAAGVHWTAAGENIGEGGPVAGTPAAIAQMAVRLTQSMLAEKPPDDGHRLNILSSAFTHAGISVFRDSSGTVWMTQDFSN